jgi:hypothetical protein
MATTATPPKTITIRPSKAPNLPIAPTEYNQRYLDQLTNALRLYFAQVDNFSQSVVVPDSGTTANRPVLNAQSPLLTGQIYFDTTLNRPIWWTGTNWIKADGTVV